MNALDNLLKIVHDESFSQDMYDLGELATADLTALRSDLETAKAQVKWWLENYDITMPCGHKNRYLLTDGRGDIVRGVNGDCVMCRLENAAEIEAELKGV